MAYVVKLYCGNLYKEISREIREGRVVRLWHVALDRYLSDHVPVAQHHADAGRGTFEENMHRGAQLGMVWMLVWVLVVLKAMKEKT